MLTHQDIAPRNLILDAQGKVWFDWAVAGGVFEQAAFRDRLGGTGSSGTWCSQGCRIGRDVWCNSSLRSDMAFSGCRASTDTGFRFCPRWTAVRCPYMPSPCVAVVCSKLDWHAGQRGERARNSGKYLNSLADEALPRPEEVDILRDIWGAWLQSFYTCKSSLITSIKFFQAMVHSFSQKGKMVYSVGLLPRVSHPSLIKPMM